MEEIHHTQKLDSPSGTSISLAKGIIENSNYNSWTEEKAAGNQIHIEAKRIENIPGTHSVFYNSEVDFIEIKHVAHNREGFALGSVIAAEWIIGRKGIFTMKDVLDLK
jgi:4-hydroxy-tetrahydrodipicolinate reductase